MSTDSLSAENITLIIIAVATLVGLFVSIGCWLCLRDSSLRRQRNGTDHLCSPAGCDPVLCCCCSDCINCGDCHCGSCDNCISCDDFRVCGDCGNCDCDLSI